MGVEPGSMTVTELMSKLNGRQYHVLYEVTADIRQLLNEHHLAFLPAKGGEKLVLEEALDRGWIWLNKDNTLTVRVIQP